MADETPDTEKESVTPTETPDTEKESVTPEEAFARICVEFESLFIHIKEFAVAFGPKGPHMMDAGNLLFFLETAYLWMNKLKLMTLDQAKFASALEKAGKLKTVTAPENAGGLSVLAGGADVGKQV